MSNPCGGCGATSSIDRCIGCLHDFAEARSNPFRELPAVKADLKKFFNEAPLDDVLEFVKVFDHFGAGELVRNVLIVWTEAGMESEHG